MATKFLPFSTLLLCEEVLSVLLLKPQLVEGMSATSHAHVDDLFSEAAENPDRWDDTCFLNTVYERFRGVRDETSSPYMLTGQGHQALLTLRDHLETT